MRITILLAMALMAMSASAQERYRIDLDLVHTENDVIRVSMWPPKVNSDTVTLVFPVTVPGTYESHNWWKLAQNVRAFDRDLKELKVTRSADSQFVITGARALNTITYEIEDSFDDSTRGTEVFAPAGTNIEHDSIFVLNHGGMIAYIDGYQKMPFQINVRRPKHLWGGSALNIARVSDTLDTYLADTYDQLVDSPVLYALPDTATFVVNGVRVLVHCAHAGRDTVAPIYAKELAKYTKTIGAFLPTMPVNHYAFLFYLWKGDRSKVYNPGGMGALEHGNSSFYFLGFQRRPLGLNEVAIHEFLHILVPLNLHSEEIDNFNFREPKMSQHLWLYEGTTEYFSTLAPLHDSTIKEDRFRKEIEGKLRAIDQMPKDESWTSFSKNVLSKEGQELYPIVYTYGAVNAMLVDIVIREWSGGKQGLLDVIYRLMQDFGPSRPFKDDSLFAHIGRVTSPAVQQYLEEYVGGPKRPDLARLFGLIGWKYIPEKTSRVAGYGIRSSFVMRDNDAQMFLTVSDPANPLGVKDGDRVLKINGLTLEEAFGSPEGRKTVNALREPKVGDELTVVVLRDGKEVTLKGAATMVNRVERHFLESDPEATEAQKALKNALFYK